MTTKGTTRTLVIAVALALGLAASAAQAAPRRPSTWSRKMQSAARVWLGALLVTPAAPERGKAEEATDGAGTGVAGIFKLKQHVDNPGQTPMKGDGE